MESFEKIYPSVEELSKIIKNQSCPECFAVFNTESNLNLHLIKTHKKTHLIPNSNVNKIYFCPMPTCNYSKTSHFKQLKLLKQHYLKTHCERNYSCISCNKGFSTESSRDRHSEYCNVIFNCCDCDVYYNCYETLKTHSRRKKHRILHKTAYKTTAKQNSLQHFRSEECIPSTKVRLILPKPSNSIGMIIITDTSEQSCQTEKMNQNNRETQTFVGSKMAQFTVETQTIGDYFTRKPDSITYNHKSAKTQTKTEDPKTVSCNTSFNVDDFELNMMNEVQRNSSSTQTNIYNQPEHIYSSTSTHDSIHTDTSDLLTNTLDSNYFNCNMETQTDFIFNDELFKYCDDYSNMCTQTCEDLLLGEIGLNDTHTQTVFDDVLKSVESQTIMSQSRKHPLSCKENVTHMETQTEAHFKQMLEEINA